MINIVERETTRIAQAGDLDAQDIMRLEKLAKVYATLMSSHRENMKYGVFGNLSLDDLDEAVEGEGQSGDGDDD